MEYAARVALGIAGGYFLGRTKKMKLALMLASTVAGRRAGGPAALLGQGKKIVGASPELSRLADEVRGRLLQSGKGVALAVAARQVESLTDRLAGRVESSLSSLADRGRPSTNSSPAGEEFDDVADEHQPEEAEERSAQVAAEDEQDEPTFVPEDGSHTKSATARARLSESAAVAAASGTRTVDKMHGRPTKTTGRNAND
jgi:hypothetical protein